LRKHIHPDKTKHMRYCIYITQKGKFKKIGEVCTGCGQFFLDRGLLKERGINDTSPTFTFEGLAPKQQ
jgi:hypothetical protein